MTEVAAYIVPTDAPAADGTLHWDSTTIVVVHAHGGGAIAGVVQGRDAAAPRAAWAAMVRATRNLPRPGITSMAISAVDVAL